MKRGDKRDVMLLSTQYTDAMVKVLFTGNTKRKPKTVLDHKKGRSFLLTSQTKCILIILAYKKL